VTIGGLLLFLLLSLGFWWVGGGCRTAQLASTWVSGKCRDRGLSLEGFVVVVSGLDVKFATVSAVLSWSRSVPELFLSLSPGFQGLGGIIGAWGVLLVGTGMFFSVVLLSLESFLWSFSHD
jgi:uncharacterized oligopeptide transporter (OPT) family protein